MNTIGVIPEHRGKGFGKLVLAKALEELRERGVRNFRLTVEAKNENALMLYKAFGFEVVGLSRCFKYLRP